MMHRGVIYVQNLLCLSSATRTYALTRTIVTLTLISCGHGVCACCWKGLPALCVGNPAYSAYSHKQADRHKGGRTEGGTDGRTQGFSIMWPVSPGLYPGRLAHLPFVSV